jgi:hypothetical protein
MCLCGASLQFIEGIPVFLLRYLKEELFLSGIGYQKLK